MPNDFYAVCYWLLPINTMLGHKNRAFLTARKTHVPTAEALELELAFLWYFLKVAPRDRPSERKKDVSKRRCAADVE